MRIRNLGHCGLSVSRVGLGLAALGRPGYINLGHSGDLGADHRVVVMRARAFEVLDATWAAGVRYFDAARSYGRAEEFLSSWLNSRRIEPGSATIGSKWGYTYTADWKVAADRHEVKDHSLANLLLQAEQTRAEMGSHLNLYQIHSATVESGVLENHGVLEELARLKAEWGWRIGLSVTGHRQGASLRKAYEVEVDGRRLFDCVQATWNVLESSSGPALAEAHAAGLGVIIKEGLANGRLTDRNDDPAFAASRTILQRQADRLATTIDALALAAVLAQPWADVVLSGATTPQQLGSNLMSLAVRWDDEAEASIGSLLESPEAYWAARSRLPWN